MLFHVILFCNIEKYVHDDCMCLPKQITWLSCNYFFLIVDQFIFIVIKMTTILELHVSLNDARNRMEESKCVSNVVIK